MVLEHRVRDILRDLFGAATVRPASIVAWGAKKAAALAPVVAHIAALVAAAPVRQLDETGLRVSGKNHWLHVASTSDLTHYQISAKRGAVPRTLTDGIVVHDHFKPFFTLEGVAHALCNAHHLRDLQGLTEIEGEPWASKMSRPLVIGSRAVDQAVARGQTSLPEALSQRIVALYDRIIRRGVAAHENLPELARRPGARGRRAKRTGHNLLVRLRDFKTEVLRFLLDFTVPFTNKFAEQDIRMKKVKMKISGGFRSILGPDVFAILRSVLSTARKRGWDILKTLTDTPRVLSAALVA